MQVQVRSSVRRRTAAVVGAALLATVASACASDAGDSRPSTSPSASASSPTTVTLAVYGEQPVVAAYRRLASAYSEKHPSTRVRVRGYADHDQAMTALQKSQQEGDAPDLFLVDQGDLGLLEQEKAVRRGDDLLAEREVDFGDGFARNALEAFSSDAALQCMPTDVSPLVVYYNTDLVRLDQLREPDRRPVTPDSGWTLDDVTAAAQQAQAPGVRGIYVAPTISQVAPFIWADGGQVVDDTDKPTTTTLSDDSSVSAVEKLLTIVRDPALTYGAKALRRSSALQRFEDGKLAMILGYRDLVPRLRAQQGLNFDVMPLPRLDSYETIGAMSGLCLSSGTKDAEKAADVLADLISTASASALAATGYVMPTNVDVVNSEAFLQTDQKPLHSPVFARVLRNVQVLPSTPTWPAAARVVDRQLSTLWAQPEVLPLEDVLKSVDDATAPILDPSATPSASPSASPSTDSSGSPTGSPTPSAEPSGSSTP